MNRRLGLRILNIISIAMVNSAFVPASSSFQSAFCPIQYSTAVQAVSVVSPSSNIGAKRPSSSLTETHLRNLIPTHLPSTVQISVCPQPSWISTPSALHSS